MNHLTEAQVATRARCGHIDEDPVFQIATKGGFHLVVRVRKAARTTETLGAGSNFSIARHIAEKQHPKLVLSGLRKSEDHLTMAGLAFGRRLTALLRARGV